MGNVSQIFTPVGSVEPLPLVLTMGPKGVPERSPLPVGKGGRASLWRALTGGVGAFDIVLALVESVFFMGTEVLGSVSISMGVGPRAVMEGG